MRGALGRAASPPLISSRGLPLVIYRLLFTLVLQRISAEAAHNLAVRLGHAIGRVPGVTSLLRRRRARPDPALEVAALGITFPSPLGVAAGLDKNLMAYEELGALGFGWVEVGTVTSRPQPGNPKPRVHRLVRDRALINRMGFPNHGAIAAAERLRRRTGATIVAVNAGRWKEAEDAAADYRETVRHVAEGADFLVLNVSSPNTPGLRAMQTVEALEELVGAVRAELRDLGVERPLLIKIAPDLEAAEIEAIADFALRAPVDGIIAVNTTVARTGLASPESLTGLEGGLSGAPLKARSLEVLRTLHARTQGEITLVSVGGVETAEDVLERILAGASLVQAYTGFVYGGPSWPARVNRELSAAVRARGAANVQALVGAG